MTCSVCGHSDASACERDGHIVGLPARQTARTRDLALMPRGCIKSDALRSLADSLERLDKWHAEHGGGGPDRPCLRRIESSGEQILAHVSTGPDVGGSWVTLGYSHGTWSLVGESC